MTIDGPTIGERAAPIIGDHVNSALASVHEPLRAIVIDLSDVQIVSGLGLGMLIDLNQRAEARGATMVLCGVGPELAALMRILKLDRSCTILSHPEELEQALAA